MHEVPESVWARSELRSRTSAEGALPLAVPLALLAEAAYDDGVICHFKFGFFFEKVCKYLQGFCGSAHIGHIPAARANSDEMFVVSTGLMGAVNVFAITHRMHNFELLEFFENSVNSDTVKILLFKFFLQR